MRKYAISSSVAIIIIGVTLVGYAGGYNPATFITKISQLINDTGFISDAPSDGSQYARQTNAWTVVSASGGGGSVTSMPPAVMWADSMPAIRSDQVSVFQATNATASTTHIFGYFPSASRKVFGTWHTLVPANSSSNYTFSFPYYSTTTNVTFQPFLEYWTTGASTSVTGTTTTIPECSVANQAVYSETYTIPVEAGTWMYIVGGIMDTGTVGTFSADINVEVMKLDKLTQ